MLKGLEKGAQGIRGDLQALNYARLTKNNAGAYSSFDIGIALPLCPQGRLLQLVYV